MAPLVEPAETLAADKPMAVVVKSLSVLTALAEATQGLTLQELHRSLEIPLASMHRILSTLDHESFVTRSSATKRYSLGAAARGLGRAASAESELVPPPAALISLGRQTGETAFLTRLVDSRIVCIALVESTHNLRLYVRVGQELPLHAAASARVILAYRDPALVAELLSDYPREAFTAGTPSGVRQVLDRLTTVRVHGFEVCDNELDENVWAVAAPVFDSAGHVEYGVTVAAANARVRSAESRARTTDAVVRAAHALSVERGYDGTPPPATIAELTRFFAAADPEPIAR